MINFFVTTAGRFGIHNYLETRGAAIADRFHVVEYDNLAGLAQLPVGGTIFAALDQITPAALAASVQIQHDLVAAEPGVAVLNDPRKTLRRFDLLRRLHDAGFNRFTVIRAADDASSLRYPVFIRQECEHNGSLTPLLHDRRALDRALGELMLRGQPIADLLIVEFCDASGADGLFRKYSAMKVGAAIVPRHVHASRYWMAKSENSLIDETLVREELSYLEDHPHASWLPQVFDLAGIAYGRIDYGLHRGQPQVWEINMNPTFGRGSHRAGGSGRDQYRHLREPVRAVVNRQLLEAFTRLDAPQSRRTIPIVIACDLRRHLEAETRARRRWIAFGRIARALTDHRSMRLVKTVLRPAVTQIAPMIAWLARSRGRADRLRQGFGGPP